MGKIFRFDCPERFENIECGGALERRPPCNRVEARAVPCSFSASFRDVQRNRQRCSSQLIGERSVAARSLLRQFPGHRQELDRTPIYVQTLKPNTQPGSDPRAVQLRFDSVSDSVCVNVNVHVQVHV